MSSVVAMVGVGVGELAGVIGGVLVLLAAGIAAVMIGWGLYRATRSRDGSERDTD